MGLGNIINRFFKLGMRRAVAMYHSANVFIDEHEEKFKKAHPNQKMSTLFVIAAAATLVPGGYTVLPAIYLGRKIFQRIKSKWHTPEIK